jgi:MarR family transcriptional regulator for hemolysin
MSGVQSVGVSISWIARMLRTRFDARARGLGLTQGQWRMIATIHFSEGCTQKEAASKLEINSVTAGRVIDRLTEDGWIERRSDPSDRRINRLYLKPEAAPMLGRLSEIGADEERLTLEGLTASEQIVLVELLARMINNMQSAAAFALQDQEEVVEG